MNGERFKVIGAFAQYLDSAATIFPARGSLKEDGNNSMFRVTTNYASYIPSSIPNRSLLAVYYLASSMTERQDYKGRSMKPRVWKLAVPATIISFATVTKWWYVAVVDAPDTCMAGFPLVWMADAWHTSMAYQVFVVELIANLLIYFLFWFSLFHAVYRFVGTLALHKVLLAASWTLAFLVVVVGIWIGTMPEHTYKSHRDYEIKVMSSGYSFIWEDRVRYEERYRR